MKHQGNSYDNIAKGFAKMRDSFNTEQKYLDMLINMIPEASHILDIGCGSGFPIADYLTGKNFHVTGIDASKKLLDIAKKKCPKMSALHGDIRTVKFNQTVDAIVEWWCLFHISKSDHELMISRFSQWLKPGGILEFTSGDRDFEARDTNMLNQELHFYSLDPNIYEQYLQRYGFKLILKESDQDQHLVWIAKKLT